MKKISELLFSQFKHKKQFDPKLKKLEKKINYTFKNISILQAAITHTSYTKEQKGSFAFERMEFLGDAILGLLVSEELFIKYPDFDEGELSKIKSKVVSRKFLTIIAAELQIEDFLYLGPNATGKKGGKRNSVLGNSLESLICAIYLDGGIEAAHKFINNFILNNMEKHIEGKKLRNYKSLLQEYTQSKYNDVPQYQIINEQGPEHEKIFTTEVLVNSIVLGSGEGVNKKEAHQAAAKQACEKLNL